MGTGKKMINWMEDRPYKERLKDLGSSGTKTKYSRYLPRLQDPVVLLQCLEVYFACKTAFNMC